MAVTLDSLRKSVGKKNVNSRAFAWLADLEREAGELDKALQRVDGGLTLYPNDIAAMLVRAKILFQKESYDACVEECEKVVVTDPFNLAAQRIMGDAYDKLENIGERNRCYRRLHDMDPLNTFWKDEYDVVVGGVAAAAMAGEISDTDFSMPDSGAFDLSDEFVAPEETTMTPVDTMPADSAPVEPLVAETAGSEGFSEGAAPEGDDPFAALAAMMPGSDEADDSAMEDLSASLDSVMDSIAADSTTEKGTDEFPEEENISGSDVGSALSDMFGLDDDLEAEETSVSSSNSASDIPVSIDDNAEANAASIFGSASIDEPAAESAPDEDKPMSIDSAFEDIFGEDELPEEKPQATQAAEPAPVESDELETPSESLELPSEEGGLFEKSADADMNLSGEWTASPTPAEEAPQALDEAPVEDKPMSIDSAFEDIFGEDELPEEKPQTALAEEPTPAESTDVLPQNEELSIDSSDLELPSDEGGLFEKSADADLNITGNWTPDLESEVKEPTLEEAPLEETSLEEPSLEEPSIVEPSIVEPSLEEPTVEEPALEEASIDSPAAEDTFSLNNLTIEEPQQQAAPAEDVTTSVDSAFEDIFGEDELPEEKPQTEDNAVSEESESLPEESASLAEQVNQAEAELELPEVKSEENDLAKEMGGAFASMFGDADDDLDLPTSKNEEAVESVSEASNEQEATSAPIEESFATTAEENISSDLDKSFDNLFGSDDSLDEELSMPEDKAPQAEAPAAQASATTAPDLDSLESEVSGAFKGLFDMDDDSLAEEKPSNKGVDFLMSGDSDDEISAGLINNPDAPLDRGSHDLDESLNTRTLAEIYFDQGLYGKALEIYKDLAQKEPENEEIAKRLTEVENLYNEKFGGNG